MPVAAPRNACYYVMHCLFLCDVTVLSMVYYQTCMPVTLSPHAMPVTVSCHACYRVMLSESEQSCLLHRGESCSLTGLP